MTLYQNQDNIHQCVYSNEKATIKCFYNRNYILNYKTYLPILRIPWFVISQQDCNLRIFKEAPCFGEKNPKAASVTWYACRENSQSEGSSCATAPTASSEILIQSASLNDTIRGGKQFHNPVSLRSLQQKISNSYRACEKFQKIY